MKLGTKVALKEKHPQLDHRCKGFVTRYEAEDNVGPADLCFWCLKCEEEIPWVGRHRVVRMVPKTVGWMNFEPGGKLSFEWIDIAAKACANEHFGFTNEIAPVYLGRKRKVT